MDNYKNEKEKILFDLVAIHNFTYKEAGKLLGLRASKIRYVYNKTVKKILDDLKDKGIKDIENLI